MRMLLKPEGTQKQRMRMLDQKRDDMLDEIHFREKQLERLDFLRHHIRKQQESKQNEQVHKYFSHMETEV